MTGSGCAGGRKIEEEEKPEGQWGQQMCLLWPERDRENIGQEAARIGLLHGSCRVLLLLPQQQHNPELTGKHNRYLLYVIRDVCIMFVHIIVAKLLHALVAEQFNHLSWHATL